MLRRRDGQFRSAFLLAGSVRRRYRAAVAVKAGRRRPPPSRKGLAVTSPISTALPEGTKVKLSVAKGLRVGKNYALKDGVTYIGRKGPQAVDVDLTEQENPGAATAVNRFALVWFDKNGLGVADTGRRVTNLNGVLIPSGKRIPIKADDTLQFGKTVLQVKVILKKRTGTQK
jgi:hypothetical protein